MKKALVMTFVLVFGVGLAGFGGVLSGTWDMSIAVDPGAVVMDDLFISLRTSLDLTFTVGTWAFGSSSTFDILGWSAQSFTAEGTLGAFSFSSTLNFKPKAITAIVCDYSAALTQVGNLLTDHIYTSCWLGDDLYVTPTYGPAFDDWTAIGSVSIAGVSFEGLFFLEGYAGDAACAPYAFYYDGITMVQTAGDVAHVLDDPREDVVTGSGWRFTIAGTAGALSITSYTYFNLVEDFEEADCGWSLAKEGEYTIATAGCDVTFTEEYIHIEGFSIGCAEFAVGLDITCSGFEWVAFEGTGLDFGFCCPGITVDFGIKFSETDKELELCAGLELRETCFDFGISLDTDPAIHTIEGIVFDSIAFEHTWNGITFSSETVFGTYSSLVTDEANQVLVFVPVTGMTDAAGNKIPSINSAAPFVGYYDAVCVYTEQYEVWESFTIAVDGDSCCGGLFDLSVTNSFGTKYELDAFAWDYTFVVIGEETGTTPIDWPVTPPGGHVAYRYLWLETGDPVPMWADITTGGTDVDDNGVDDALVHAATATTAGERLLTGSLYEAAAADSLFEWVATEVDLSVGIGSAWSLIFGLDIDVYGWNALEFGFAFTF